MRHRKEATSLTSYAGVKALSFLCPPLAPTSLARILRDTQPDHGGRLETPYPYRNRAKRGGNDQREVTRQVPRVCESQRLRPRFQHSVYPLPSAGGVRRRRPTVSKILLSFSHHGPSICWALGSPPSHGLILAYRTYILWSLSSFHLPSLNEGFSSTIISYLMVWSASIARPVHYTPRIIHDGLSRSCLTSFPRFALSLGFESFMLASCRFI